MAFEPIFEVTKFDSLRRICSSQAVVEARMMPAAGVSIARVLSIATDCTVSPSEVFAGEARYNGRVCFKMVFVDPDGVNHSTEYNADFTDKLVCENITAALRPIISASILDTDVVNVGEKEIKLAAVIEVFMDAVCVDSVNLLAKGGEDIYTHEDAIEFSTLAAENTETFSVIDTIEVAASTNLLLAEPRVILTKVSPDIGSATVEGKVIADFTLEDSEGMIHSVQHTTPFSQEVALTGADENASVIAFVSIASSSFNLENEDDKSAVNADYSVSVGVKAFAQSTVSSVVDAFSVTHELLVAGESLKISRCRQLASISDRVDGAVTLDVNMPIADNIMSITGAKVNIANAVASQNKITFEGVVSCNVVYYSAENNTKSSVAVEMPFSLGVNAQVSEGDEISARGVVTKTSAKIRRGNEIDIKTEIEIEATACQSETKYIITELKMGEQRTLPTSAFSIHIAKGGETLWDVAKALGSTPEIVLMQNPKLTLPLAGGERVIAYRNLK